MINEFVQKIEELDNSELIKIIQENKNIINEKDDDGWNLFQLLAYFNKPEVMQYCLDTFSKDELNNMKTHFAEVAIESNNVEFIKTIFQEKNLDKLNLNIKLKGDNNLLHSLIDLGYTQECIEILKVNPDLLFEKNTRDLSPIVLALQKDNKDILNYIIDNIPNITEQYEELWIIEAVKSGNVKFFEFIHNYSNTSLDYLFNISYDFNKINSMAAIVETGDFMPGKEQISKIIDLACQKYETKVENKAAIEVLDYLFEINIPFSKFENESGQSAWMLAIKNKNDEVVKRLANTPENVNVFDNNQESPLMYAIKAKNHGYVKTLLKKKANPNVKNRHNDTALIMAVRNKDLAMVSDLIDRGAHINEENNLKQTALTIALKDRNIPIVSKLIWAGAEIAKSGYQEINEKDLFQIGFDNKPEIFTYHEEVNINDFIALSKLGLKLNQTNEDGDTFAMHFIKNSHYSNLKSILKCSINPNELDMSNNNIAMLAAQKNNIDYLSIILSRFSNIDFNTKNNANEDIYDICFKSNNLTKVDLLLNYDKDISEKNISKTLIHLLKHSDIEQYWEYFDKKVPDLLNFGNDKKSNLLMFCVVSGNIKNFDFILEKVEKSQLTLKNDLGKTVLDLIESIPDTAIRMQFENSYNQKLKKTKHP